MRSLLRAFQPSQLLWATALSNTAVTLTVVLLAVRSWHLPQGQHLPANIRILGFFAIFFFLAVAFTTESALQRGMRSGLWTEAMLSSPRRLLSSPAVPIFTAVMFVASILYFIVSPLNHAPLGTLFFTFPPSLIRMSQFFKSPDPIRDSSLQSAFYPAKPLQSDQWGRSSGIATVCQALSRKQNPINH
jgi:hypothetical protein